MPQPSPIPTPKSYGQWPPAANQGQDLSQRPVQGASPSYAHSPYPADNRQTPPGKGKKLTVIIIAAAALLAVILAGVYVFASEDGQLLLQGKAKFSRNIITNAVSDAVIKALTYVEEYDGLLNRGNSKAGSVQMSLNCSVNANDLDKLIQEIGLDESQGDMARLAAASAFDMTLGYDFEASPKLSLDAAWKVQGGEILKLNCILIDNVVYISSPDLYDRGISLDLSEFGVDATAIMTEMIDSSTSGVDFYTVMTKCSAALKENEKTIQSMAKEVTEAFFKEIQDMDYEKNADVSINGKTVKLRKISMNIDGASAINASKSAINVILGNEAYLSAIASVADSVASNLGDASARVRASDVRTGLEDALDEISNDLEDDGTLLVDIYATKEGEIAGMNFSYTDTGGTGTDVRYIYSPGTGYEFWTVNREESSYSGYSEKTMGIYGDMNSGSSGSSGNIYFAYKEKYKDMPEWDEDYKIKIGDYENLRLGKVDGVSVPNVKLTIGLKQLISDLEKSGIITNPEDFEVFSGSTVTIELSSRDKAMRTDIVYSGGGTNLSFSLATETGTRFTAEADSDAIKLGMFDIITGGFSDLDMSKLMDNVNKIYAKLEKTGINVEWLNSIIQEYSYAV